MPAFQFYCLEGSAAKLRHQLNSRTTKTTWSGKKQGVMEIQQAI